MSDSTLFGRHPRRLGPAVGISALAHALVMVLAIVLVHHTPGSLDDVASAPQPLPGSVVWLSQPGPGGGGGGGGNRMPGPIGRLEVRGADPVSMPAVEPTPVQAVAEEPPTDAPRPDQRVDVPIEFAGAALDTRPGIPDGPSATTASLGPGSGGGAGGGRGTGIGNGTGPGLGDGSGGGTGGGVRQPGSGTEDPILIRHVKPLYTAAAMRAHIQGTAWLECLVLTDGTVESVRVIRSLDASLGLDDEAVKAARQWRFRPARRAGQPIPVVIAIAMDFRLH